MVVILRFYFISFYYFIYKGFFLIWKKVLFYLFIFIIVVVFLEFLEWENYLIYLDICGFFVLSIFFCFLRVYGFKM